MRGQLALLLGARQQRCALVPVLRTVVHRLQPLRDMQVESFEATNRKGLIYISNQQELPINKKLLSKRVERILEAARVREFDIGIQLMKDVQGLNSQYRKLEAPTDILSFPFHEDAVPGEIPDMVPRDDEDLLNIGDCFISVPYVKNVMEKDQARQQRGENIIDPRDRGVLRAMTTCFDLDKRISLLLVHGVCHLMNYDHETEEDFQRMAALEEQIMKDARLLEDNDDDDEII